MADGTLEAYNDALTKVKSELTAKRTELASLAKQTVAQLEPKIIDLRSQADDLAVKIIALDKVIADKKKQSNIDEDYWKNHYLSLEETLKAEYQNRQANLNVIEDKQTDTHNEHVDSLYNLSQRENQLSLDKSELENETNRLEVLKVEFEEDCKQKLDEINNIADATSKAFNKAEADQKIAAENSEAIQLQVKELNEKIIKADAVIARISEANIILDAATIKEALNVKKEQELKSFEEKLNQKNVKSIADAKNNMLREEALDDRERTLNERDNNLKIAEAALKEG